MKRLCSLFLAMLLVFIPALAGCSDQPVDNTAHTSTEAESEDFASMDIEESVPGELDNTSSKSAASKSKASKAPSSKPASSKIPSASKPSAPVDESAMSLWERDAYRAQRLGTAYLQYFYNSKKQVMFMNNPNGVAATNWEYGGMMSVMTKLAKLDSGQIPTLDNVLDGVAYYGYIEDGQTVGYVVHRKEYKDAYTNKEMAYDDNMWVAIEFLRAYEITGNRAYLERAQTIADFLIRDAWFEPLGGFFWDYRKQARHSCSNCPMIEVFADLYSHTGNSYYLEWAKKTFQFTLKLKMANGCFEDLIGAHQSGSSWVEGRPGGGYHSYNTGAFISGASALYRVTKEPRYLEEAKAAAKAAYDYFGKKAGQFVDFPLTTTTWFNAILLKGFVALYPYAPQEAQVYINAFQQSIDYAYDNFIRNNQLPRRWLTSWGTNNDGSSERDSQWALDQGANAEIYGILALFNKEHHP